MLTQPVVPLPKDFPERLQSYCEQMSAAREDGKHHDYRRALFMEFLRGSFGVEVSEVDLEHKVRAASARGFIDAFYRFVIFEVKTDLERERGDALSELQKYFEAQDTPSDYVGAVTDGLDFEVYDYDPRDQSANLVRAFKLESDAPSVAYSELDELLAVGRKLPPLSEEIVLRFGPKSLTFTRSAHALAGAFEAVKDRPSVQTKFREWNALLAKVYGNPLGEMSLFIKHTYLTMVSRAIVTVTLFRKTQRSSALYRGLIDGGFFRTQNIQNLAEPDFFSWALGTKAEPTLVNFLANVFRRLEEFDWNRLDEDLLKMLYQELVDPADRSELGEFYTPDWLAELALKEIDFKKGTLLDPACGSGTFLFCAIRRMREQGLEGDGLVRHALESVIGIDVHPVAVLMAKANILLALAKELSHYSAEVSLRVYMADTLMTGENRQKRYLGVKVGPNQQFHIPLESLERGRDLDKLVDAMAQFAKRGAASTEAEDRAGKGFEKRLVGFRSDEMFFWRQNFRLMVRLVGEDRDSIWAFILKNAYRPAYLRRQKVDIVAANPPWLSLRDITDEGYKDRIKELTFQYKLLGKKEVKLFTQMDTSTVFFVHAEREFLKDGGRMAFVMPKSVILPAKQHFAFQRHGFSAIHDFSQVDPLFRVRSCLVISGPGARKDGIPITRWSGNLVHKNLPWRVASTALESVKGRYSFLGEGSGHSPYHALFVQGAALVPHCLWFVEAPTDRPLNQSTPFLRTSKSAKVRAKDPWRVHVEGVVEKDFLFATALAEDILPFAVRKLLLLVLPVAERNGRITMLRHEEIVAEGAPFASDWVKEAERIWERKKKKGQPTIYEYLDYNQKLTNQHRREAFIVLYNKSGTNLTAAVLAASETERVGGLTVKGFVADHVTYRYYADTEDHALYLVGVLNTRTVNAAIKPYQSQGLMGERDIHRRPFEVCSIPFFDPRDALHQKIAQVARGAREKMLKWKSKIEGNAAQAREASRRIVRPEIRELDGLAKELLRGQVLASRSSRSVSPPARGLFGRG
ncbi:MAG TPA: N-6 DNA methylase [Candidatus Acidoferrales bacterium]|nr:N-6 DNA methylase [Candidatus Acidoferrales bacterium]